MKRLLAGFLLLLTTFFWGITFTIVKDAVAQVDVFVFLSQRFVLALLLMLPVGLWRRHQLDPTTLRQGFVMGVFLFGGYAFQTLALLYTSASNTGFLTGLNVVLVPLIGALYFHQQITAAVRWGVVVAVAGLFLLCTNGTWALNSGDLLAIVCAVSVSIHLLLTGEFSRHSDVFWLTAVQLGTVALLSIGTALVRGERLVVYHPEIVGALVICAVFATVLAFLVQTTMQRYLSPSHTALIFCMEPVFAALYAYIAAGERLGPFGFIGAGLIFAGMLLSGALPVGRVTKSIRLAAAERG